jgi:alpha-ketoglutarate-dependent taurine dioxygenase
MNETLDKIITDEHLAWDKTLSDKREQFVVHLDSEIIQELIERRNELDSINKNDLPLFKKKILNFRNERLLDGVGLFVIDGICMESFSVKEKTSIYTLASKILGELIIQNIKQEKIVEIKDIGKSMKTGGRYHETKEGGSHHTDSPQWKNVPDYLGLFCVHNAKKGGTNLFLSAYTIHNRILQERKDLLDIFYEKFYFDKRGEFKDGESPTVFQPIFELKNKKLFFRYLRNYIDAGHDIQNQPLSQPQKDALTYLDNLMHMEDITLKYDLKPGDMVFSDNHRVVHGRTSFEDYDDENLKRFMLRTWIKDQTYGIRI